MKYTDIKEGMRIRILKCPTFWRSSLGGICPLYGVLQYPWEGDVEKTNDLTALISGYGFDIKEIKEYEIISNINYQIY